MTPPFSYLFSGFYYGSVLNLICLNSLFPLLIVITERKRTMAINSLSITSLVFLCVGYFLDPVHATECSLIETTVDQCRNYNTISVEGYDIKKNSTNVRVTLPGLQTEAAWNCGPHFEKVKWGQKANQLRVHFQSTGEVQWRVYKCSNLAGPKKSGDNCAVAEVITFCPGDPDGNNSESCVYEVTTGYEGERRVTTITQVSAELGVEVEKGDGKGSAGVSGGSSKEVSDVRKVTYESKQYLVVPPGYSLCSFTNNTSEADKDAPTGFKWVCYLPRFVQIRGNFENVPCTTVKKCASGVCPADSKVSIGEGFSIQPQSALVLAFGLAVLCF